MTRSYRHWTFEERCQVKIPKKSGLSKGLDCATPAPHLRSDYTLTGMRAGCCTSDWKRRKLSIGYFAHFLMTEVAKSALRLHIDHWKHTFGLMRPPLKMAFQLSNLGCPLRHCP